VHEQREAEQSIQVTLATELKGFSSLVSPPGSEDPKQTAATLT
jgi:hypothetical protein